MRKVPILRVPRADFVLVLFVGLGGRRWCVCVLLLLLLLLFSLVAMETGWRMKEEDCEFRVDIVVDLISEASASRDCRTCSVEGSICVVGIARRGLKGGDLGFGGCGAGSGSGRCSVEGVVRAVFRRFGSEVWAVL
jgi:hypothetical protein